MGDTPAEKLIRNIDASRNISLTDFWVELRNKGSFVGYMRRRF